MPRTALVLRPAISNLIDVVRRSRRHDLDAPRLVDRASVARALETNVSSGHIPGRAGLDTLLLGHSETTPPVLV